VLRAVRAFLDQAPELRPWSQVSEVVYGRLGDGYRFSDGHIVNLKGKGPTAARFLLGRDGTG
jgi:hypothetical protein